MFRNLGDVAPGVSDTRQKAKAMKSFFVRAAVPSLPVLAFLAALLLACDRAAPGPAGPHLKLAPDSIGLGIHGSFYLAVNAPGPRPANVVFSSSDTAVVVVDTAGRVQAVGYGTAYVHAWDATQPTLRDSMRVRVPEPAGPWLVLLPDSAEVVVWRWGRLTWRLGGTDDPRVSLASSDTMVVAVDDTGAVCARGPGRAVIHGLARGTGATDSIRIFVVPVPSGQLDAGGIPTISISAIVDTAGRTVAPDSVRGNVRITLRLDMPRCYPPVHGELRVDQQLWQSTTELVGGSGVARTFTFTLDTRLEDATGQPLIPNGSHTLNLLMRGSTGTVYATASQSIVVTNP